MQGNRLAGKIRSTGAVPFTEGQRKCDELKEVRKYMLQNMFPKA